MCESNSFSQWKRQRLCVHVVDLGFVVNLIRCNTVPLSYIDRSVLDCSNDACRNLSDNDGSFCIPHRVCISEGGGQVYWLLCAC